MAQSQINLGVALNFDDSQYKSGVKSVEQSLKKFSTTPAFVKLKLDDTDFRKQYQGILADLQKKVQKTGALNYKTTKGKAKVADSIGTIQAAYKYNLEQSQNTKLSTAEINTYKKREEVLRQYLNLLKLVGQETKRNAQLEKERANMGVRMEKARMTGKVAAERQRAYKVEFADEKEAERYAKQRHWVDEKVVNQDMDAEKKRRKDAEKARARAEADAEKERKARIREKDARDKEINRHLAGGSSNIGLAQLRDQFSEEEKKSAKAARERAREEANANRESERQLKNRVKAKRNAANIETAIDNERLARDNAIAASDKTNTNRTLENVRAEIKALKDLKKAEDELDRAQGKRARNKSKKSETNQKISALEQESEVLKKAAEERAEAEKKATEAARRETRNRREAIKKEKAMLKKLTGLIARAFSVHQIIRFGEKIAETTGYFQQQQIALEGILGSATKARSVLNDITNFALKSPFRTDELVRFTKQLSAFGIEEADLFPTVTKLADISAGLGVDMDRIILAYGQVRSAAVLRGQELRQFTEAGIPMVEKLAEKFTELNGEIVTTADVFELISDRKVSFEMVSDVLSDMTKEGGQFYKMQEELTNTLAGQISKLKDMWNLALNDMGKTAGSMLNTIIKLLQNVVKDTASFAVAISAAFSVPVIAKFTKHFRAYVRLLRISIASIKGIGAGVVGLAAGAIGFAISKIVKSSTELKTSFNEIEKSFRKDTDKMLKGLDSLTKKISTAKVGTQDFADAIETLSSNYGDFVSDDILNNLKAQGDESERLARNFGETANSIREAIIELKKFQELEEKRETVQDLFLREKTEGLTFRTWMRNNELGTSNMTKDVFKSMYGRDAINNRELLNIWDELYDEAVTLFASGENLSKDEFEKIFSNAITDLFPKISKDELLRVINLGWKATSQNTGAGFKNLYKDLVDSQNRINNDRYHILTKTFEDTVGSYMDSEDLVQKQNNMEAAYVKALRDAMHSEFGESASSVISVLDKVYGTQQDGDLRKIVATNFNNNTVNNILKVLNEFESTLTDSKAKAWLSEARKLFEKGVEDKSDRAAIVSNRMEDHINMNDPIVSGLWRRYIPSNNTYKALREQLVSDYKTIKSELESYVGNDPKDEERKSQLRKQKETIETLASAEYFAIKLEEVSNAAEQIPVEVSDLLESIKTAYTRYKEATQNGGVDYGLDYVRNNEYFKKTFGAFFGGNSSKEFQEIAGIKIGNKTAGDILKDKFMTGLEDGIVDFNAALSDLQKELEEYGNADKKQRKSYLNAAKTLEKWIDSTFSKDNLNATLLELQRELNSLTNTFSKTNKVVDLYRQLQEKGTVKTLGAGLGVTKDQALTPESVRLRDQVIKYIAAYNSKLPVSAVGFRPESLESIDDISKALDDLGRIIRLNDAFDASGVSKAAGEDVKKMLEQLLETMMKEMLEVSSEVFTGNAMHDMIANSLTKYTNLVTKAESRSNIASAYGAIDMSAIKELATATQDEARALFSQFMKDNRLDVIAGKDGRIDMSELENLEKKLMAISKNFPKALQDELLSKLTDLRSEVDKYNASVGAYNSFTSALQSYRGAKDYAKNEYAKEFKRNVDLSTKKHDYGTGGLFLTPEEVAELNAELALSDERLKEMGIDGEKLAKVLEQASLENLDKSVKEIQTQFQSIVGVANSIVGAVKAFSNTINKVYDVMNEGENPEWMQEMDGLLNDFGEAFDNLIAPITAVISLIAAMTTAMAALGVTATTALWWMAGIVAVAAAVAGIIAAFQSHDRKLQRTIEDLQEQIEETENAMTNLNAAAERMVGLEKQESQLHSLALTYEQYIAAVKKARAEDAKHNTDSEKLMEYRQEAQQYLDEFLNGIHDWREEILFSVTDMASSIAGAMRSAFQSGANAAREMAAVVKQSIGDMVMNMIEITYLQPAIQTLMEDFFGGTAEQLKDRFSYTDKDGEKKYDYKKALEYFMVLLSDDKNLKELEGGLKTISTGLLDFTEGLGDTIGEYIKFNGSTSSLSGGISGITEDTARQLEGLNNSMLIQLIAISQYLSYMSNSGFAQVQVSWFNDMLSQTRAIKVATENIDKVVKNMYDAGSKSLKVTMS